MKKWKRILGLLLALCMLADSWKVHAWPALDGRVDLFYPVWYKFYKGKPMPNYGGTHGADYGGAGELAENVEILPGTDGKLDWKSLTFSKLEYEQVPLSELTFELLNGGDTIDLRKPTPIVVSGARGNYPNAEHRAVYFLMGAERIPWTDADVELWYSQAEEMVRCQQLVLKKIEDFEGLDGAKGIRVGNRHYVHKAIFKDRLLYMVTLIPTDVSILTLYGDKPPFTVETLQAAMRENLWFIKDRYPNPRTGQGLTMVHTLLDYWSDYVDNNRIAAPEMQAVSLGGYYGVVNPARAEAVITVPKGVDITQLGEAKIEVDGWVKYNKVNENISEGRLIYYLYPYEEYTALQYNGIEDGWENGYGYGVDLGKSWQIRIEEGEPLLELREFLVELGGETYRAKIDQTNNTVLLRFPEGTDLTRIPAPTLTHTAQSVSLSASGTIDFTKTENRKLTLTTSGGGKAYTKEYTLDIRAEKSPECEILSYRIGEAQGQITGENTVQIEVPWGTDLSKAEAVTEVSEKATLTGKPAALAYNTPLSYTVTAENGTVKTWAVTITERPVAQGKEITAFSYGSAKGTIDQTNGTITLTLPAGVDITRLKPTVEVSPWATVSPASGAEVNASSPVTYTVTSQSGKSKKYTLTVVQEGAKGSARLEELTRHKNNIINYYTDPASPPTGFLNNCGDWEWFDIGMAYRGNRNNSTYTNAMKSYDMYKQVAAIGKVRDYERVVLSLTALGFDASNLDAYRKDNTPFKVGSGREVSDLVAAIYNAPTENMEIYDIIFALLALDAGNYSVPADASWTREKLLEELLSADMSGRSDADTISMLLLAIAPYRDHAVYGSRVRAKQEEGLAALQRVMKEDYAFTYGGTKASESSSWAIMALASMGIDADTDPRFGDGTGTTNALTKWLEYLSPVSMGTGIPRGFAHTKGGGWNAMATQQGCYALQSYLGFLNNGGAGTPYDPWYHMEDFSKPFSSEAKILSFSLEGQEGQITDTDAEHSVKVTLPVETSLDNMSPQIRLSAGARLDSPKLPVTFEDGVAQTFRVVAEDGNKQTDWSVTVSLSSNAPQAGTTLDVSSIALQDEGGQPVEILGREATPNGPGTDIMLTVGEQVDLTKLRLTAKLSPGATADVDIGGTAALDLSDWKIITVTSGNGEKQGGYRIRAQTEEYAAITGFSLSVGGKSYPGTIDGTRITVPGIPQDADVRAAVPEIALSEKTQVCSPLSGVPNDFTRPQEYTVSGRGLKSRTYTVTAVRDGPPGTPGGDAPASDTPLTSFRLLGVEGEIDHLARTVTVTLPEGTDVSRASPEITLSAGWAVSPGPDSAVDLTAPVTYTLSNGVESRSYLVTVMIQKTASQQIWEKLEDIIESDGILEYQSVR